MRKQFNTRPGPTVLVVDDESQVRILIESALLTNGYSVKSMAKGEDVLSEIAFDLPNMVILDVGQAETDGAGILRRIREWSNVPVLVLTGRSTDADIIACLDAGADDFVTKPILIGEMLARVRNALNHRNPSKQEPLFVVQDLQVDLASRTVRKGKDLLKLTATEYAILSIFVENAGKVVTHKYILEHVWGPGFANETQYTRVYVGQLRKKIEDNAAHPKIIVTESGIGYRLVVDK